MFTKIKKMSKVFTITISCLFISQMSYGKPKNPLKEVVDNLENLQPEIRKSCSDESEKKSSEKVKEVSPELIFGFIQNNDPKKPVSFFINSKTAMKTSGRPNKFLLDKSKSDLRAINSAYQVWSGGAKTLNDISFVDANLFIDKIRVYTKEEIEDSKIILALSKLSSEADILSNLETMTKGFSYDRKLHLLASIGANFSAGYDFARTDSTKEESTGVVTTVELFSAINSSISTNKKIDAGVCRDMHLSMAKMARAMGIKNAYGLSFQTRASAHMVLTTTPDSYGKVSIVNYGNIETSSGASGLAAFENQGVITSWGQRIEISSPDSHRMLIKIPTRLAQEIHKASGGDKEALIFGDLNQSTGINMGVRSNYGNIIFDHQNSLQGQNQEISGIYYQLDKSPFSFFRFNGAIGYFDSTREAQKEDLLESGFFARFSTTLGDKFNLGKGISISSGLNYHYSYLSSCRRTSNNLHCVEDDTTIPESSRIRPDLFTESYVANAGLHYDSDSTSLNLGYKAMIQPVVEDIRDNDSQFFKKMTQQQFYLDYAGRFGGLEVGAYGRLNLTDLEDQIVKTYQAGGHLTYKPIGLSILGESSGRIESEGQVAPVWIPGTENRQLYRLTKDFDFGKSRVGVEYQFSEDFPQLNSGFVIFSAGH